MAILGATNKQKLYDYLNSSNNETIEYLDEGYPIETTVSGAPPVIAGALRSNNTANGAMEYLYEGVPLTNKIDMSTTYIAGATAKGALKVYHKFGEVLLDNNSYRKYKGKSPFNKTLLKSMLWKSVKDTSKNINRTKKFLAYCEKMGGFKTFEDFVMLMIIQDKFLTGASDSLKKIEIEDLSVAKKNKIKTMVKSIKEKVENNVGKPKKNRKGNKKNGETKVKVEVEIEE